jgi:hypothetical protein
MTMICRISDDVIYSPWDEVDEQPVAFKALEEVSLYDLGSEDLIVWLNKSSKGFQIEIEDENGNQLVQEKEVHPAAMESMAYFCNQFLRHYNRLMAKETE